MKHVLILGATGMLGSAVAKKLTGSRKYRVTATCRGTAWSTLEEVVPNGLGNTRMVFDPECFTDHDDNHYIPFRNEPYDYIINCIGIIKPQITKVGTECAVRVNSLFPHVLARYCAEHHIGLIHITTDCVYSGVKGNYIETDVHDCDDVYGKTKSLGEPADQAMVLRTSIIGPEIHNFSSLVSWAQSQAGKAVNGFTNHKWNGITTKMYGAVVETIIDNTMWGPGLFHVFSPRPVTKFELLQMIDNRYELHLAINSTEATVPVDRILDTKWGLCHTLNIPDLRTQIAEM